MAMIVHHARRDGDGVNAIFDEANREGRGTELLLALLDGYESIVPQLRTEAAMACLTQAMHQIAEWDEDPDCRRAAAAIVAHSVDDVDRFNKSVVEAAEQNRTGQLFVAICDVYAVLLPELSTPLGTDALRQWAARIAGKENAT